MSIRINNLILDIEEEMELLHKKAAIKLNIKEDHIKKLKIVKESIDARKRNNIKFNYCLDIECDDEEKVIKSITDNDIRLEKPIILEEIIIGERKLTERPVIIGFGPAGIFASLLLARKGYKPLIIERGENVECRNISVEKFWKAGKLNIESNVQFGEGGAGTFSDGKLTTKIKDRRCDFILEEFIKAGAKEEIIYRGKPHIGTDILKDVVKNIREEIISLGGEIHFNSKLQHINYNDGRVKYIIVNDNEIPCEVLVLATGHSSRDTYEMLNNIGIAMEPKAFTLGVRIEHLQDFINENQYGRFAGHPRLKAADYRLVHNIKRFNRSVYSFCMCPGGEVVAAASEEKRLVTNGMSYYKRNKENANSALVVTVNPEDFQGNSPLKGMEFQRYYEELAYNLVGDYIAPVQLVGDFLKDRRSTKLGRVMPSYRPGYEFRELSKCLPSYIIDALKIGINNFDSKIKGYGASDSVLTGIETRTSAPVKIIRNEFLESISLKGLYPVGEGSGYAGGIISSAIDGVKVAECIMREFSPED